MEGEKKKMTELTYGHPPLALTEKLYFSLFLSGFHESYNLKKDYEAKRKRRRKRKINLLVHCPEGNSFLQKAHGISSAQV